MASRVGRAIAAACGYCILSSSLRFVPHEELDNQGYGDYLNQVEDI
jgi:hypothetical protein